MNRAIDSQLLTTVRTSLRAPSTAAVNSLAQLLLARYGEAVQAIVFYGSCQRNTDDLDGLFDLYLLVDDYRAVSSSRGIALLGRLLPPNVYYLETRYGEKTIRAKYAILSMADLARGTSRRWFHSYLWARFCQPTLLVYRRDDEVAERVVACCAQAVVTFVGRVLPRLGESFSCQDLWQNGLALTYRAELRPEKVDRPVRLFMSNPDYFREVTRPAMASLGVPVVVDSTGEAELYRLVIPPARRLFSCLSWRLRIIQGKFLSVVRLIKASLTFAGGADYIAWKIERHTGVQITLSPFQRRHPVVAMFVLARQLLRRGAVK